MNENNCKEVRFDKYCKSCEYAKLEGFKDPCNECLGNPVIEGSEKPIHYRAAEELRKKMASLGIAAKECKEIPQTNDIFSYN